MNIKTIYKIILLLSLTTASNSAIAANNDKYKKRISSAISTMKNLFLAKQVIQLGIEEKDPLSLIVAYTIAKNATPEKSTVLTKLMSNNDKNKPSSLTSENYLDVIFSKQSKLITKARTYANGNSELLAIIGDAISESARGAGELVFSSTLAENSTNKYYVTFSTDELAGVYVEEVENTGLQLSVVDAKNNILCETNNASNNGYCSWQPKTEEKVTIIISNTGHQDVSYYMLTN